MNLSLFIAGRLYGSRSGGRQVSRPAITIATLGIAVGLAVMIVSVCVVLGFKNEIRQKLIGFGTHIQVANLEQSRSYETTPIVAGDSLMRVLHSIQGIKSAQRFITKPGLIKTEDSFRGVALKGVGEEYDLHFLAAHLEEGEMPRFSAQESGNRILISRTIADEMNLKVGDRIYTYFIGSSIRARRFTVSGIYRTNLAEFDKNLVFADLHTLLRLNNWETDQVSGVELTVQDEDKLDDVYRQVVRHVNRQVDQNGAAYYSETIQMLYPSLFAWLDLLDINVWIILALMVAVAGFTMVSGLLIIILERTNMIGVLKALGASDGMIRRIFLTFSVFLIGRGLLIGNVLGLGICLFQQWTGFFHLDPETYYVDTVPILLNPLLIIALNLGTLLISVFVLVAPSYLVSHIHPAKSIRFE